MRGYRLAARLAGSGLQGCRPQAAGYQLPASVSRDARSKDSKVTVEQLAKLRLESCVAGGTGTSRWHCIVLV